MSFPYPYHLIGHKSHRIWVTRTYTPPLMQISVGRRSNTPAGSRKCYRLINVK